MSSSCLLELALTCLLSCLTQFTEFIVLVITYHLASEFVWFRYFCWIDLSLYGSSFCLDLPDCVFHRYLLSFYYLVNKSHSHYHSHRCWSDHTHFWFILHFTAILQSASMREWSYLPYKCYINAEIDPVVPPPQKFRSTPFSDPIRDAKRHSRHWPCILIEVLTLVQSLMWSYVSGHRIIIRVHTKGCKNPQRSHFTTFNTFENLMYNSELG